MGILLANHKTVAASPATRVRCVECNRSYQLPPLGAEFGCPACGGPSWVVLPSSPQR